MMTVSPFLTQRDVLASRLFVVTEMVPGLVAITSESAASTSISMSVAFPIASVITLGVTLRDGPGRDRLHIGW